MSIFTNLFRSASATPKVAAAPSVLAPEPKKEVKNTPPVAAPSALEIAKKAIEAEAAAKASAEKEANRLAEEAKRADVHVQNVKVAAATLTNARKESEAAYARLLIQKGQTNIATARVDRADQALLDLVNGVERVSVEPVVILISDGESASGNISIQWDEPEQAVVAEEPVSVELMDYFQLYRI